MLEWLAATTGVELGKLVLNQVLDLGKPVLEGYVQDFFKHCLHSGVSQLKAETLKVPMAEAIGYFIKCFIRELQINDVPETSIQHHYQAAIKKFVQDKAVRPILGNAFEKGCKQIDYKQLDQIWVQQYQESGWQFPSEEFDWRGVCKEYLYEVRGIVKANPELREILNSDLLEDIARNTAQLSPGFDVEKYRHSLHSSYGYLKLYTLDSTDRVDAIKLWAMFVEQTVREALPPMRYDVPLDVQQKSEFLEHSDFLVREYFQQPARKVLEAVADSQRAVILGDPGSGKSSLLQYLALEWVEDKTEKLPLLIELREFAINPSANFLEFLHSGRGVDWQFDQQQLHQYLLESPTLVMFDGLDEVFDRATQSTVIDDIIRFSQKYPKAQVLVTSRIIGYNPDRLQHSEFQHFTIQSLDTDEIHEFTDRWYDLSMGSDPDKVRLKQRLKDAIANSKAIANLADNPLLLTMMAILNRRQELPRDRADLYDQASRVLLYHWDVDHKRLQIPMDAIGRREKQEMLRLVAYEMQAGEEGLKGNLIGSDRLTHILTDYLREQGFSEPREKANLLIQQLRERNFIICYRGADTYGFMHRTFLEYFCAVEIVHRFEKQRTLTFEQLRDEVFGQRWHDETWHEVLRLICGAIDPAFAGGLIEFLMLIKIEKIDFLEKERDSIYNDYRMKIESIGNLSLAAECLSEITNRNVIANTERQLLRLLMQEVELEKPYLFSNNAAKKIIHIFATTWGGNIEVLSWIKLHLRNIKQEGSYFLTFLTRMLVQGWRDHPDTLSWVKMQIYQAEYKFVRQQSVWALAEGWKDTSGTLDIVKDRIQNDENSDVRSGAIRAFANVWRHEPQTLTWLKLSAQNGSDNLLRYLSVREIIRCYSNHPETFEFLVSIVLSDLCTDSEIDPRIVALKGLCSRYPKRSKTLEILKDRAINSPNKQLREWSQEQLEQLKKEE